MSLKTWKDEFYPVPACDVKKKDALAHSLKKWEGLTKRNLKKHKVTKSGCIIEDDHEALWIVDSTCALCVHFADSGCPKCPLTKANNGQTCCVESGDTMSKYEYFVENGNPHPMIRLIKKAIAQKSKK